MLRFGSMTNVMYHSVISGSCLRKRGYVSKRDVFRDRTDCLTQHDVWLMSRYRLPRTALLSFVPKWALIYRDAPDATRPYPFRFRFCLFLGSWLQERSNDKLETSRIYPSHH